MQDLTLAAIRVSEKNTLMRDKIQNFDKATEP